MTTSYVHDVVSKLSAYPLLRTLEGHPSGGSFDREDLLSILASEGVVDAIFLLEELLAAELLMEQNDRIVLSSLGVRTALLLEALNSGNVAEVFTRLSDYDSTLRMYELVREGMTDNFLDALLKRPGFKRLYLCSPWISLTNRNFDCLQTVIIREEQRGIEPEVFVITRPQQGTKDVPPKDVQKLQRLGATIFLHPKLHTKLYIREPGPRGGDTMAIVGSQNLTQSQYLELGIRINSDSRMVNQLVAYFFDLTTSSIES